MKKITVKTIWSLLAFSAVLAFTNCEDLDLLSKKPEFSLNSVELADISFEDMKLLCKVNVENPNRFTIPFPEIDWELFINTNQFINGTILNGEPIKSRGTTVVEIPVSLKYEEVFDTFKSLEGSKELDYKIALDAKFTFADIVDKVLSLEFEDKLPVLQAPNISFDGIKVKTDVKNISITNIPSKFDFELGFKIGNDNDFAMTVNNLSYFFYINKSKWSELNKGVQNTRIAANGITPVPITFSINSNNMLLEIVSIIIGNKDVEYTFEGEAFFGADLPLANNLGKPFSFSGETKLGN